MKLLYANLRWQAVLWAGLGVIFIVAPRWFVGTVLDQPPPPDDAWLRAGGLMALAVAAQMVMVRHRIEGLWWWSWTFVLLELALALVFASNAVFGPADGAPSWPWWLAALVNTIAAAIGVVGLSKAGAEGSPV